MNYKLDVSIIVGFAQLKWVGFQKKKQKKKEGGVSPRVEFKIWGNFLGYGQRHLNIFLNTTSPALWSGWVSWNWAIQYSIVPRKIIEAFDDDDATIEQFSREIRIFQ